MYAPYNAFGIIVAAVVCGGMGYVLRSNVENLGVPLYLVVCGAIFASCLTIAYLVDRRQAAKIREAGQSQERAAD